MQRYEGWERNEAWIDLKRFPNYQISTYGRIRNKRNDHILKPSSDRYGYLRVSIGNTDNVYIHRLMCEAFYGEPTIERPQVNHIDCDRQNNHFLNLAYCSPSENIKWGIDHGDIDYRKGLIRALEVNRKPVRIIELDMDFPSVKDCAEFLNIQPTRLCNHIKRGLKVRGYHVEYI